MPASATAEDMPSPRKRPREARRVQLIEATIETLALRGYARTTLTEVATRAGLSHGLVNFHFQSKDKLLSETLLYLAEEYRQNWTEALEAAGEAPAARLDALIRADLRPPVYTAPRLAAWLAFWGEAQARPVYQDLCASNDAAYNRVLEEVCSALLAEGGYAGRPARVARVIRVAMEGVWMDQSTMERPYGADEALATVHTAAAAFFPRHFDETGLIDGGQAA